MTKARNDTTSGGAVPVLAVRLRQQLSLGDDALGRSQCQAGQRQAQQAMQAQAQAMH